MTIEEWGGLKVGDSVRRRETSSRKPGKWVKILFIAPDGDYIEIERLAFSPLSPPCTVYPRSSRSRLIKK